MADRLSRLNTIATHPPDQEEVADLFAAMANGHLVKTFPLSYMNIAHCQKHNHLLQQILHKYPDRYKEITFPSSNKEYSLFTKENKIVLPKSLQEEGAKWYHEVLMHQVKQELSSLWVSGKVCNGQFNQYAADARLVS